MISGVTWLNRQQLLLKNLSIFQKQNVSFIVKNLEVNNNMFRLSSTLSKINNSVLFIQQNPGFLADVFSTQKLKRLSYIGFGIFATSLPEYRVVKNWIKSR